MFSEDDVIFNRKHLATVKCMDFRGELLVCHANVIGDREYYIYIYIYNIGLCTGIKAPA